MTRQQAVEFRDFVERWIPVGQQDLAHFIDATGGQIGQLDGSVGSLIPLWEWMLGQVSNGIECIPAGLEIPIVDGGVTTGGIEGSRGRAIYLAQCMGAYLYLVCEAVDQTVSLQVFDRPYRKVQDIRHFSTCAVTAAGEWIDLQGLASSQIVAAVRGKADDRSDLRRVFLTRFVSPPTNVTDSPVSTRMAVLAEAQWPSPGRPAVPSFSHPDGLPAPRPQVEPESDADGLAMDESELSIVKGATNSSFALGLLDPIHDAEVSRFLASLGEDPEGLHGEDRQGDGSTEIGLIDGSIVSAVRADGAVRAIFLERGDASDTQWSGLVEKATEFAESVGAYIGPNDRWPGSE